MKHHEQFMKRYKLTTDDEKRFHYVTDTLTGEVEPHYRFLYNEPYAHDVLKELNNAHNINIRLDEVYTVGELLEKAHETSGDIYCKLVYDHIMGKAIMIGDIFEELESMERLKITI